MVPLSMTLIDAISGFQGRGNFLTLETW